MFISQEMDDTGVGEIIAYLLLFALSGIDIHRDLSHGTSDDWFTVGAHEPYEDSYNYRGRGNCSHYPNAQSNAFSLKLNVIDNAEIKKIRTKLAKTNAVKVNKPNEQKKITYDKRSGKNSKGW